MHGPASWWDVPSWRPDSYSLSIPIILVPGGVYGASIVLHNLFPSIQVGTFGYMFDIPLLILSVLLLGAKLGIRTIVAALLTPLLMNTMSRLVYPTREALESLDRHNCWEAA